MRWTAILSALATLAGAALGGAPVANARGYHVEYAFQRGGDAGNPNAGLLKFRGQFYGATVLGGADGLGAVYAFDPASGAETVVYSFKGGADGAYPYGGLIDVGGKLYGTTFEGGAAGVGTVFSLDPASGVETVVYAFKGAADGANPVSSLLKVGGKLYGSTQQGGAGNLGGVFSLDPASGVETLVYAFKGGADGAFPRSGLIDVGGLLYGTAVAGGGGCAEGYQGCGVVYSLDPASGAEAVVHAFTGFTDGDGFYPNAGVIKVGGVLLGTTAAGGVACAEGSYGCGTVYSLDPATGTEAVVYAFKGGADGFSPVGRLIKVGDALYGTTEAGGNKRGVVYSLDPATGAETVLHAFGGLADGRAPDDAMIFSDHRLWGTTGEGGGSPNCGGKTGCGVIFSIRP